MHLDFSSEAMDVFCDISTFFDKNTDKIIRDITPKVKRKIKQLEGRYEDDLVIDEKLNKFIFELIKPKFVVHFSRDFNRDQIQMLCNESLFDMMSKGKLFNRGTYV